MNWDLDSTTKLKKRKKKLYRFYIFETERKTYLAYSLSLGTCPHQKKKKKKKKKTFKKQLIKKRK